MSKITIKTETIKDMVDIVNRGLLTSKLVNGSNYICVRAENKVLYIYNSDIDNHLEVRKPINEEASFKVFIEATSFIRLINLLNKQDEIAIEVINNNLTVSYGRNRATFTGLPIEDCQDMPYSLPEKGDSEIIVDMALLKKVLGYLPGSVNIDVRDSILSNYYFGEFSASSNNHRISYLPASPFGQYSQNGLLIPAKFLKLMNVFASEEKAFCSISENGLFIYNDKIAICGLDDGNLNKYPAIALKELVDKAEGNEVLINKDDLSDALNRLKLFLKVSDKGAIHFIGEGKKLQFTSLSNQCLEEVILDSEIDKVEGNVDIDNLISVLSMITVDKFRFSCDGERFIRISIPEEGFIYVTSLMEIA